MGNWLRIMIGATDDEIKAEEKVNMDSRAQRKGTMQRK
jgi:hypothetical protein